MQVTEIKAAAGMTVASAGAFMTWLAGAHEIVQFLAALAALAVAVLTARFYWLKGQLLKKQLNKGDQT